MSLQVDSLVGIAEATNGEVVVPSLGFLFLRDMGLLPLPREMMPVIPRRPPAVQQG